VLGLLKVKVIFGGQSQIWNIVLFPLCIIYPLKIFFCSPVNKWHGELLWSLFVRCLSIRCL
jgi:hypothetical protein